MKKLIFLVGAFAIVLVNLMIGVSSTPTQSSDLTLQNIEAVGLSAAETVCEPVEDNRCIITGVGEGNGKLIHYN